jgi:hypothetical protein
VSRLPAIIETWVHPKYKEAVPIRLNKASGEFTAVYGEHELRSLELPTLRRELQTLVDGLLELTWIPMLEIRCSGYARFTVQHIISRGMTETAEERHVDKQEEGEGHLDVHFSRSWIAQKPNGTWLRCAQWHSVDEGTPEGLAEAKNEETYWVDRPLMRRLNAKDFYEANRQDSGKGFTLPHTTSEERHFQSRRGDQTFYVPYTSEVWVGLNDLVRRIEQIKQQLEVLLGSKAGRARLASITGRLLPAEPATRLSRVVKGDIDDGNRVD